MNFRQKLICTTYGALIAFIVCLVMNLLLISIGCDDGQQQPPKQQPVREDLKPKEDDMATILEDYQRRLKAIERKRLEGFMTASESKRWLSDNRFQVQKNVQSNKYIITSNHYPGPPIRCGPPIPNNEAIVSIMGPTASALVTINEQGIIRVCPTSSPQ